MQDCTKCEKFFNCNLVDSSKHIHVLGPDDKIPVEMAQTNNNVEVATVENYSNDDILNNTYFNKLIDSVAVVDNEKKDT